MKQNERKNCIGEDSSRQRNEEAINFTRHKCEKSALFSAVFRLYIVFRN